MEVEECEPGFHPYKCLVAGVAWPEGVDPKRREEYLGPIEFVKVFGMTKVFTIPIFNV